MVAIHESMTSRYALDSTAERKGRQLGFYDQTSNRTLSGNRVVLTDHLLSTTEEVFRAGLAEHSAVLAKACAAFGYVLRVQMGWVWV